MPLAKSPSLPELPDTFPGRLKAWRQRRRMSQLDLALEAGVSQRHVSFLESGRAKPSRVMILQLSETLEVPLRERNDWLVSAGFAPVFQARPLEDPQMGQVMNAIRLMLSNHAPYPAVAIDRAWNLCMANGPFEQLVALLDPELWNRLGGRRNMMRLFFHPQGIRPYVANWKSVANLVWHRANREAQALGGQDMQAILAGLAPHQEAETLELSEGTALMPVLPLELEKDGLRLSLFTVIATFGTAQDVTADELRIESLFPADAATERLFQTQFHSRQ